MAREGITHPSNAGGVALYLPVGLRLVPQSHMATTAKLSHLAAPGATPCPSFGFYYPSTISRVSLSLSSSKEHEPVRQPSRQLPKGQRCFLKSLFYHTKTARVRRKRIPFTLHSGLNTLCSMLIPFVLVPLSFHLYSISRSWKGGMVNSDRWASKSF